MPVGLENTFPDLLPSNVHRRRLCPYFVGRQNVSFAIEYRLAIDPLFRFKIQYLRSVRLFKKQMAIDSLTHQGNDHIIERIHGRRSNFRSDFHQQLLSNLYVGCLRPRRNIRTFVVRNRKSRLVWCRTIGGLFCLPFPWNRICQMPDPDTGQCKSDILLY